MDPETPNIHANRYNDTRKPGQGFWRLMLVWHGSVFKLIWAHLVAFVAAFTFLSILYHHVFIHNELQREMFELICIYCSRFSSKIPVTFMTGFYVANVVSRYWDQFLSLPMPDKLAYKLVAYVPGQDEYSRTIRRTVMRQVNLSTVLVFRRVANKVLARFPTHRSLVDAGLMMPHEASYLEDIDSRTAHETTWAPILWAIQLLQKERSAGKLKIEPPIFANLISSFEYLETSNRRIFDHGWVNFPLAYTQVITITIYTYLFSNLFGHQFLEPRGSHLVQPSTIDVGTFQQLGVGFSPLGPFASHTPVVFVPVFTIIEFVAYLGWIKVAETLLNPWGDDDEDFQVNYLIDRNFQTSLFIVDEAQSDFEVTPDAFMSKATPCPSELPYSGRKSRRTRRAEESNKKHLEAEFMGSHPVQKLADRFAVRRSKSAANQLKHLNRRIDSGQAYESPTPLRHCKSSSKQEKSVSMVPVSIPSIVTIQSSIESIPNEWSPGLTKL